MWKKLQDDALSSQTDSASKENPDLASLGDALVQSLVNDQFKKGNFEVVPPKPPAEENNSPVPSSSMKTYTEALNEFTTSASAFIEHLPLLEKARAAYEQAMKASAEMRHVLDAGEENLRSLMSQLEQGLGAHGIKSAPTRKTSEPAKIESKIDGKIERMTGTTEGGRRSVRWP